MPRSIGRALPDALLTLLDGQDLAAREGLTFLLLTTDDDGWPHLAMLSVGEIVATDRATVRLALWLHSATSDNLTRGGKTVLSAVADGKGYNVRMLARREDDLDLGPDGRLARFTLLVDDVLEDAADYAVLTSGITFRLNAPETVVPRWQHTVDALRAAA